MTNYTVFENYFDLGDTITKYGIKDESAKIHNCDKSGMTLEH